MNDKKRYHFATNPIWAPVAWPCVVRVTGEDAADFLQGQFSQDLRRAGERGPAYGFWLTRTGKVQGDAWVAAEADGSFTVLSRSISAEDLMARLEHHIIADDVYLEDTSGGWRASWWLGDGVMDLLQAERAAGEAGAVWVLPELGGGGYRVARCDPTSTVARPVEEIELERRRILAGWPRVPVDIGIDDLPQEGGLEAVGVCFNKGCYLGQEVMARLQTTGRVRRRLVKVRGAGGVPEEGAESLWAGAREVGMLRSRIALPEDGWAGLAMIGPSLAGVSKGELGLGAQDGPPVQWWG